MVNKMGGKMEYSRNNPSARYREMIEQYRCLHREGEKRLGLTPEETFPGISLFPHIIHIKKLIDRTDSRTILDYGCGKGMQYDPRKLEVPGAGIWDGVIEYWDVDEVCCYDPCYERYSKLPDGKFDGVISTDVLEHCVEDDIAWIVEEMFSYAKCFVFANVACYPAKATLPNGENAHCTVRPRQWWDSVFTVAAARYPGVVWKLMIEQHDQDTGGRSVSDSH
jgi:hypothetical protein